jgi:hypothetical protein
VRTPGDICRQNYRALSTAYNAALAAGNHIKAGNIKRQMDKTRKAAWGIKVLNDKAQARISA